MYLFPHAAITCPALKSVANGSISYFAELMNNTDRVDIGVVAYYSCVPGFSLAGPSNRTCMNDDQADTEGVWSGEDPSCLGTVGSRNRAMIDLICRVECTCIVC